MTRSKTLDVNQRTKLMQGPIELNSKVAAQHEGQLFDRDWYTRAYPDVLHLGIDPLVHFQIYGQFMGRLTNGSLSHIVDMSSLELDQKTPIEFPTPQEFIAESVASYKISYPTHSPKLDAKLPKVSVIMTCHNSEQTIDRAIQSILFQTWPNLECIVVDDASTDGTWERLSSLARQFRGTFKAIRLQVNLGTYIAKNIGILESAGEIIMFQDSDDYSHPERVEIQAAHLAANHSMHGNRTKYCRFNPVTGSIVPVSDLLSKLGLITLAVRRSLFDRIGYFDPVRKAGDDEWFERARKVAGRERFANLDVTMYMAELRQNSLASDLFVDGGEGGILQQASGPRAEYGESYKSRHASFQSAPTDLREQNPPVPKQCPEWVPSALAAIPRQRLPIFASMCSIPERSAVLPKAIQSIIDQVDHIYVHLDKYNTVPEFLVSRPKITVTRSEAVSRDLRDNAKFLPYNMLKSKFGEFFFLTLDDDIRYPYDYVAHHLQISERFNHRCITGVHGVLYEDFPTAYFQKRIVLHYRNYALQRPTLVNGLGTGTTGFCSSCFSSIDPFHWERGGMVDIYMSILAKLKNIPMLSIPRTINWLTDLEEPGASPTLFSEFKSKDELIVAALKQHEPWGYHAIQNILSGLTESDRLGFANTLPAFADTIDVRSLVPRFRG